MPNSAVPPSLPASSEAPLEQLSAAVWIPLGTITKWAKNPRKNQRAVPKVARSIRKYGFVAPVVVWESRRRLVAGHTRIAALESILAAEPGFVPRDAPGVGLVPVRMHEFTDETEANAYAIADNKLAELSEWEDEGLAAILADMKAVDAAILEETGFDERELAKLLGDGGGGAGGGEDPGAETHRANELQAQWGTATGQLWEIPSATVPGKSHRLLCGDSTKREDVARVMGGEKAALCATDPPYLVDYTGERPDHDGGNQGGKDWTAVYHEIDIKDATGFFRSLFTNVLEVLAPHAAIYCWHAHKRVTDIILIWRELGILDHQQIIWTKPTPVFGRVFWHFQHEPCLMGWRKGSIPTHDGDQSLSSVWAIDWDGKARATGDATAHPTSKPVEIFARPMRKHTARGDVCFEPFSGSGSQLVAAEQTGRRCHAIELEPAFVAVALERMKGMGLEPRLA